MNDHPRNSIHDHRVLIEAEAQELEALPVGPKPGLGGLCDPKHPLATVVWNVGTDPPKDGWYLASTAAEVHQLSWCDTGQWFMLGGGVYPGKVIAWAEMPRPVDHKTRSHPETQSVPEAGS